ncbi:MAG: choice-of-anchor L domain-containing protein, partial [Bacteroidota bacterium]
MKKFLLSLFFFVFFFQASLLQAQLTVSQGTAMGFTPLQLVQSQLVGQGIVVSNATYNGSSGPITSNQIGYFTTFGNALVQLGIEAGLLLTSGTAANAIGPNNSQGATGGDNGPNDPDLDIMTAPAGTHDKCVLEFDFVPQADTLRFKYVFGSEEFYEYCNQYNDAFGFFLSGPGITGTFSNSSVNIALMPGSPTYVTINNLCANGTSNWNNLGGLEYQYDGVSYVFTAWHVVVPCSTYHIKLAIADAGDWAYDSGVFIEKNSFNATGLMVTNYYPASKFGSKAVEGCSDATVAFVLQSPTVLPYTVNWTVGGTATNGIDYTAIGTSVTIPAGGDSAGVVIHPYLDAVPEPTEYVVLAVTVPSCSGPTIFHDTIYILDNSPFTVTLGTDTTTCLGDSITLTAMPNGGKIPYDYSWNIGSSWNTIKVAPPVGVNTFIATVTDGCMTSDADTIIVTIDPLPLVSNTSLLSSICSGTATSITPTCSSSGAFFSWTATCSSPNVTGYSGGNGLNINQTLFNSGLTFDTVKYHVHAIVLGCTGPETVFKVVVKPKPNAYFVPNGQNICTGQSTNIDIFSNVPGTTFSWTYTISSLNIIGANNGAGNNITQSLTNIGNTIDTVTYHIIPVEGTCTGNIFNVKVVVNPFPTVTTMPLSDTICSNASTNINLTSNVSGSTYTWVASLIAGNISGFSNGGGGVITQTLINNDITIGKVKYRVIPSANGCLGLPQDIMVIVDPVATITNSNLHIQLCSGGNPNITFQSTISGGTFTWTASSSSLNITGFSSGSGPGISQVLVNSGFTIDSVTYHVTPYYNGCIGIPVNFVVKVFPTPDFYATPPGQSICSGTSTSIGLNSHVTGTTFT